MTAALVFTLSALCACVHVMEPVPDDPQAMRVQVSVGDTVRVLTKDSERRTFTIDALDTEALVGKDVRIPYSEIVFLEKKALRAGQTATAIGLGALATALLVITVDGAVYIPPE